MSNRRQRIFSHLLPAVLAGTLLSAPLWAAGISGDLYFTTYKGDNNVNKIPYDYDGTKLTLWPVVNVAQTDGSDGLIFAPDNDLLVGGQADRVHKINISTQAVVTHTAGGIDAYHMAMDPSLQYAWASGIPGGLAQIPLSPFADGIKVALKGDDTQVTSLAFQDADHAFYTNSGTNGSGNFGTLDMKTFTTHRLIKDLQGGHGMAYDPYTGDLMLFGGENVVQIEPSKGTIVSSRTFPKASFDQGTVDSKGHLFVADGNGTLLFIDYAATRKIGDTTNYVSQPKVADYMDDVAPLSGPGSNPNPPGPNPKPDTLAAVTKALYQDADGDGRIDQAWLEFPKAIGALPAQIQFQDPFDPSATVTVAAPQIVRIDETHVLATFKDKEFTAGTGFDPKPYGKILADKSVFDGGSFVIGDGVGPRIASAVANPPANAGDKSTLTVTFSEAVKVDAAGGFPFDIKRAGSDPSGKFTVVSVRPAGGNTYVYTFDGSFFPLPGDSLRIKTGAPAVADAQGNLSNTKDFVAIGGTLPKSVYNLENERSKVVSMPKIDAPVPLPSSILILDQSSKNGTCLNCPPGASSVFSDQITSKASSNPFLLSLKVNAPFRYDISFFDNLGVFVNQAKAEVTAADLARLGKDKDGNYLIALAWWPVSDRGSQVGTGAYIAKGTLTTTGDLKTIQGTQGEYRTLTNKSENVFYTFGYLRR